ncbi:hypothetical protein Gotri_027903, partial [Gossypium trilobum]|nr:hypothetical protein [Gossypium trilobum]
DYTKNGILRHPTDDFAWDAFDKRFLDFAVDPRNVRLIPNNDEKGPDNEIDVYMLPLIDELKQLWTRENGWKSVNIRRCTTFLKGFFHRFNYLEKLVNIVLRSLDEACKRFKHSMPTHRRFSAPQDNVALENEVYTQVFSPDKYGKVLGYGCGMTKYRLFGYEARLIAEAEERFMKLTEIREAKFMDMMDAHEKKNKALFNECMKKGMSSKYKTFHT